MATSSLAPSQVFFSFSFLYISDRTNIGAFNTLPKKMRNLFLMPFCQTDVIIMKERGLTDLSIFEKKTYLCEDSNLL